MIFYFTGTDNGKYLAELYSKVLQDNDVVDIRPLVKSGEKRLYNSEKPYVFIVPIHSWQIPKIVEKFIDDNSFAGNRKIYFIFNCGGSSGNAQHYVKNFIVNRTKLSYMGNVDVVLPDSYFLMFTPPAIEKRKAYFEKANIQAFEVAKRIMHDENLIERKIKWYDHIYSSIINPFFNNHYNKSKSFTVSDECIGCGRCEENCPVDCIVFVNKKPTWNDKCMQCLSCISRCPTKAIDHGGALKKRDAYLNTYKLSDFEEQIAKLEEENKL